MGRKSSSTSKGKNKCKNKKKSISQDVPCSTSPEPNSDGLILISPTRIRYQYSRIRPYFSGCGRSVVSTLDSIREGKLSPNDLPPIQVLVGPHDDDEDENNGPWYFSLNNRRLWVFKQCAREGLLDFQGGKIWVRIREPKSQKERERYTVENCAVEAKFIRKRDPNASGVGRKSTKTDSQTEEAGQDDNEDQIASTYKNGLIENERKDEVEEEHKNKEASVSLSSSLDGSSSGDDDDAGGGFVNRFAGLDF